tara:strand:- start:286 stop:747 length:462 start_codon:yes stop_codon:yes gene_type:complete
MAHSIKVQRESFDVEQELLNLRSRNKNSFGAVVSFVGLVRDLSENDELEYLELEYYPGMTESSILEIVELAEKQWLSLDIVIIHRVGRLASSDPIVLVQVASPHRDEAFQCCEFLMDYLKTDAVFWKKEVARDGTNWVQATDQDNSRKDRWGI